MTTQPDTPRRVLTEDEFQAAYIAARNALGHIRAHRIGGAGITDTIAGALATVGILTPPFAPDEDTCTALCADDDGTWWQCAEEPGHDGDGHDCGDLAWTDEHPDAVPPAASGSGSTAGARENGPS